MVQFYDLRLSSDSTKIHIYLETDEDITKIEILNKYLNKDNPPPEDILALITEPEVEDGILSITVDSKDFDRESFYTEGLIHVVVYTSGQLTYTGVIVNWKPIYQRGLDYMKSVVDGCCKMPREFIDYILRLKALELAIKTSQYTLAEEIYSKYIVKSTTVSPCNCS